MRNGKFIEAVPALRARAFNSLVGEALRVSHVQLDQMQVRDNIRTVRYRQLSRKRLEIRKMNHIQRNGRWVKV